MCLARALPKPDRLALPVLPARRATSSGRAPCRLEPSLLIPAAQMIDVPGTDRTHPSWPGLSRPSPRAPLQPLTAYFAIPVLAGMAGTGPAMTLGAYVNLFGGWYYSSPLQNRCDWHARAQVARVRLRNINTLAWDMQEFGDYVVCKHVGCVRCFILIKLPVVSLVLEKLPCADAEKRKAQKY